MKLACDVYSQDYGGPAVYGGGQFLLRLKGKQYMSKRCRDKSNLIGRAGDTIQSTSRFNVDKYGFRSDFNLTPSEQFRIVSSRCIN